MKNIFIKNFIVSMLILGGFILTGCAAGQEKKETLAIEPLRQASMAEQKSRINAFFANICCHSMSKPLRP